MGDDASPTSFVPIEGESFESRWARRGYFCAVLLPLAALIIGPMLMLRGDSRGRRILATTLAVWASLVLLGIAIDAATD